MATNSRCWDLILVDGSVTSTILLCLSRTNKVGICLTIDPNNFSNGLLSTVFFEHEYQNKISLQSQLNTNGVIETKMNFPFWNLDLKLINFIDFDLFNSLWSLSYSEQNLANILSKFIDFKVGWYWDLSKNLTFFIKLRPFLTLFPKMGLRYRINKEFLSKCVLYIEPSFISGAFEVLYSTPTFQSKLKLGISTSGDYDCKFSFLIPIFRSILFGINSKFSLMKGIDLRFRFSNQNVTFLLPIKISSTFERSNPFHMLVFAIFVGTPIAKYFFNIDYFAPLKRLLVPEKDFMKNDKIKAEIQIRLISTDALASADRERSKFGLVITSAYYGALYDYNIDDISVQKNVIDVTIPLQFQVISSRLEIPPEKMNNLKGVFDPCIGKPKWLRVKYLFRGLLHQATFNYNQEVILPKEAHLVLA